MILKRDLIFFDQKLPTIPILLPQSEPGRVLEGRTHSRFESHFLIFGNNSRLSKTLNLLVQTKLWIRSVWILFYLFINTRNINKKAKKKKKCFTRQFLPFNHTSGQTSNNRYVFEVRIFCSIEESILKLKMRLCELL